MGTFVGNPDDERPGMRGKDVIEVPKEADHSDKLAVVTAFARDVSREFSYPIGWEVNPTQPEVSYLILKYGVGFGSNAKIVEVDAITLLEEQKENAWGWMEAKVLLGLKSVLDDGTVPKGKCVCDMVVLMRDGCQCGGE
jgi:hypothetical protein